ncbi:FecR domain-containing protein [Chitinophaga sp. OAE865]|uniref:FecR domain-containing protein n=1 Tax=Chitinophaga sp. OAE865 TaxID=2817898 RepID=UPI001AE62A3A
MTENNHYIAGLIGKYLENSLNAEEESALTEWINASEDNRRLFAELNDPQQLVASLQQFYAYDTNRISRRISEQVPAFEGPVMTPVHRVHFIRRWGWAAAVALLLAGSAYLLVNKKDMPAPVATKAVEITPGTQGAILTLADGRQVVLDSMASGVVAHQGGTSVVLSDGKLQYDPSGEAAGGIQYNKMTTPKGRQFEVTLPDGTKVWLNAASSIRYPTAFTGNERKVEVYGEACFEVARDAGKPFLVNVNNKASIEVLGTLFNVNAYENEKTINTTLLNGSIKVATHPASIVLKPGQQAQISTASGTNKPVGNIEIINHPDMEKTMAWKNGLFNFEGAGIEEVMRQLERWYNIDVVYENGIPDIQFIGEMSRQISLSDLLEILRRTEVDFRVEGRKLIVLNK